MATFGCEWDSVHLRRDPEQRILDGSWKWNTHMPHPPSRKPRWTGWTSLSPPSVHPYGPSAVGPLCTHLMRPSSRLARPSTHSPRPVDRRTHHSTACPSSRTHPFRPEPLSRRPAERHRVCPETVYGQVTIWQRNKVIVCVSFHNMGPGTGTAEAA